ncbi:Zinc finger protein 36, C3H1 type-like 1 [Dirofilaria immitis]|nr:Zinc finger protein 36, C3H1 type-like 1 [Dirofilaria immitis]
MNAVKSCLVIIAQCSDVLIKHGVKGYLIVTHNLCRRILQYEWIFDHNNNNNNNIEFQLFVSAQECFHNPQRAMVPLRTEQLAASPVCNQKQQPVIENAVPVQLCQLLKQSYGLEEGADPYIIPSCPNILFVLHRGQLRAINSFTRQTVQQDSIPSVIVFIHLVVNETSREESTTYIINERNNSQDFLCIKPDWEIFRFSGFSLFVDIINTPKLPKVNFQLSNDGSKGSSKSPSEDAKGDGRVAPPATPVTPLRPSSTIGRQPCEPEWHKAVSDQERELWKRECRRTSAYKTSLCNPFRNSGKCSYGLGCRFAHGVSELRPAPRPHPKYKTQLCNKFALYGSCPYGSRCQFIHMRPCEMQNDLGYMNFAASLDGDGRHALKCRHYSMYGRPRRNSDTIPEADDLVCSNSNEYQCQDSDAVGDGNARVLEAPASGHCNSFPQFLLPYCSGNGFQVRLLMSSMFMHFFSPGIMGSVEGTPGMLPIIGSNGMYSDVAEVDDLFSGMSIAESSPFTQSCFPRINVENCAGTAARHVNGADMSYRTS